MSLIIVGDIHAKSKEPYRTAIKSFFGWLLENYKDEEIVFNVNIANDTNYVNSIGGIKTFKSDVSGLNINSIFDSGIFDITSQQYNTIRFGTSPLTDSNSFGWIQSFNTSNQYSQSLSLNPRGGVVLVGKLSTNSPSSSSLEVEGNIDSMYININQPDNVPPLIVNSSYLVPNLNSQRLGSINGGKGVNDNIGYVTRKEGRISPSNTITINAEDNHIFVSKITTNICNRGVVNINIENYINTEQIIFYIKATSTNSIKFQNYIFT